MAEFSIQRTFERARGAGIAPRVVFDIGVASGTNGLYGIFEGASYVLVDPLEESEPIMRGLCERYPGSSYFVAAAGSAPGRLQLAVHPAFSPSSLLPGADCDYPRRDVEVVTLDNIAAEQRLAGPFVIKVDVQGFELEVFRGARQVLRETELVICEVSFWSDKKQNGAPELLEILEFFNEFGFVPYDIAGVAQKPLDGSLAEFDIVLCPRNSPLRRIAAYTSKEQDAAGLDRKRQKFLARAEQAKEALWTALPASPARKASLVTRMFGKGR